MKARWFKKGELTDGKWIIQCAVKRFLRENSMTLEDLNPRGFGIFMPACEFPAYIRNLDDSADTFEVCMDHIWPTVVSHYDE